MIKNKTEKFRKELEKLSAAQQVYLQQRLIALSENDNSGQLIAFVQKEENSNITEEKLLEYLGSKLATYMLPAKISFLEKFPHTPNGKIDRTAMHQIELTAGPLTKQLPQNALEKALRSIWESVLNIKDIGTGDNFFRIGGHSLLVTSLVTKIRDVFPVDLSLNNVFDHPTIRAQAQIMATNSDNPAELERTAELYLQISEMSEDDLNTMLDSDA